MRYTINFDSGWKFHLGDLYPVKPTDGWGGAKARAYDFGVPSENFDDSDWRTVELPHDFICEKDYCFNSSDNEQMRNIPEMESIGSRLFAGGCLEGDIAWYRKKFRIDKNCKNKRIYIHFGGVYRNSTIYINQYYVGTHTSGYTGFYYDITDFININTDNIIAVRVDASDREGWWYEGGGIYRHVLLEITDNVHIEPWGVFVNAVPNLKNKSALITVDANIINRGFEETQVLVQTEISDNNGHVVSMTDKTVFIGAWDKSKYSNKCTAEKIKLWDIEEPNLYSAVIRLYVNNMLCDEYTLNFGIREMHFDADTGFYLNGKHIKIKGLCCHHDHAGLGIGVTDSVHEYRIERMKSMGANALRSSHYPASTELLDICDRLGMLVFEETRRMSSAPEDIECLRAMVKRDRNHPSIFLWGIGNEEIFSQHRPETAGTTRAMMAEIKKLDKTRLVTSSVVCWDGVQRYDNANMYIDVTKHLDIMGFNYCASAWDDYHKIIPEQSVIITEATSNSGTRGCYSTDESKGWYYVLDDENFDKCKNGEKAVKKDAGELMWKACAERDYLAGIFLWTGIDYRGEPTPLSYPAVYSQFGVFDYCGFEKDNYYYYKSWWTDEPVLHILPHWNFSDKTGKEIKVYCYSNLDEIEIFVNGKSYGKKRMERNWYLEWENVIYEPGEISAKAYKNGKVVQEKIIKTTGEPYQIRAEVYKNNISIGDTAIINVGILDENGSIVPNAGNEIHFTVYGEGRLLGTGNGDPGSHENEKLPVRRAFNGKCQALIKIMDGGDITVTAESNGLKKAVCVVSAI